MFQSTYAVASLFASRGVAASPRLFVAGFATAAAPVQASFKFTKVARPAPLAGETACTNVKGKIYAASGKSLSIFDPQTNIWEKGPDKPKLPYERNFKLVWLEPRLVLTGTGSMHWKKGVQCRNPEDPAEKWIKVDAHQFEGLPALFVYREKVYFVGETYWSKNTKNPSELLVWNHDIAGLKAPDRATQNRAKPQKQNTTGEAAWGRNISSVIYQDKRVYIVAEDNADPALQKLAVWTLDLDKMNYTKVNTQGNAPLNRERYSLSYVKSPKSGAEKLLVYGGKPAGITQAPTPLFDVFDIATNTWEVPKIDGDQPTVRHNHGVANISDSRVIFVGGNDYNTKSMNDSYLIDIDP